MSKLAIVVVGGDAATAAEGIPIVDELRKRGHSVRWIMDQEGEGRKILEKRQLEYELYDDATPRDKFDLILVLTSATAVRAQHVWTCYGRVCAKPVVWYEDFPGTAHVEAVRSLQPDTLMVINEAAADIARQIRPLVPIHVVGKPSFESRADMTGPVTSLRMQARGTLGVDEHDFVVVYWSGGETIERVEKQLAALRDVRLGMARMVLAPRIHPKLDRWGAGTQARLIEYARTGKAETFSWHSTEADTVNAAADVMVCDAGCTEAMMGALMGIPTIITRFPDDYARLTARGLPGGVPMVVTCGAVLSAESGPQLVYLLSILAGIWQEYDSWEKLLTQCFLQSRPLVSLLEPGAAVRIAKVVEGYRGGL
ncbi:MAG: hypothetical protein A3G57_00805 [Candidatus Andersenbacteria bacterium RIFCSPLOWO2_12_FULL_45_8]|nr:MAG: hypothetical protein UW94_C0015G0033 [Parcubacteria group bacterium GW2011_GWA2_45_14]OGY33915.1 MAG: hypothetical protein A3B76_01565 [Candidatus Andersenbacteria bacterium RIFCSPHIGHO2_02_FULL_46_16]OGY36043.1 MAG: hypothetical protein A3I08_02955 [Candidatus Andersenbacteria bacterium RIFCSPLOWO2_02_FULL_46_11]OGY41271.1 MAG: hypothetical protein A3G57_00805 [Candidatus Andersenbacteria bacterium RIFCSPLOWO2_12_FULL_45_8]HBE89995.1 hypothetical protein [Candidatus Andersenbacteria ba